MAVGVVGVDSISWRKGSDNMRKGENLRERAWNGKEVKGEMVICILGWWRWGFRHKKKRTKYSKLNLLLCRGRRYNNGIIATITAVST